MNKLYLIVKRNETDDSVTWYSVTNDSISFLENKIIPNSSNWVYSNEKIDDIYFSNCYDIDWTVGNGNMTNLIFNKDTSILLFLEKVREVRNNILLKLDIDFMKSLEIGDSIETKLIADKKQSLRDITKMDLSNITNLEELKAKWPIDLLGTSPF